MSMNAFCVSHLFNEPKNEVNHECVVSTKYILQSLQILTAVRDCKKVFFFIFHTKANISDVKNDEICLCHDIYKFNSSTLHFIWREGGKRIKIDNEVDIDCIIVVGV